MSRIVLSAKALSETVIASFDFASRLAIGETISSAGVAATVYSGDSAATLTTGAAISGTKVNVTISGGGLGTVFLVTVTADTSLFQALALDAFVPVVPDAS